MIYHIYPRSFADGNGDGLGDLTGILDHLDYVADLGVDAIYLNPLYRSPMADFGYDISNHVNVDPTFGTLADLDRLIAAAHRLGLRVILDFVPNHTSDRHPWFVGSRSSRADSRRDWYYWRDPAPDGGPPNNWVSAFGGPAWTLDPSTGQYYLHTFLPEQPDLNWRNPDVEYAMHDVARFWLDRGVDGFRIDVANFVMKDPLLRDNPPASDRPSAYRPLGAYDTQLHLYDKNHPDTHAVYRRLRTLLDDYPGDRIALGEIHVFDWPDWRTEFARYHGEQLDELHLPIDQSLIGLPWSASHYARNVGEICASLPHGAWPCLMLGSHDETRIAARLDPQRARAALVILLTLPATPILYFGDELGMTGAKVPPHQALDPWAAQTPDGTLGRDPQRSPMQWTAGDNAGFCPPDVDPWLPIGDDTNTANVAGQQRDPGSMLNLTRRLLRLRAENTTLSRGELVLRSDAPDDVLMYERRHKGRRLLVAVNFTAASVKVHLDGPADILAATSTRSQGSTNDDLALLPHEAVLVQTREGD
ncbi:MAG: alpha-amylase family glycosyl hydrolase [Nocardioidaceae bacterium]